MATIYRALLLTVFFLGGCGWVDSVSKNADLESLSISSGTLEPGFSPAGLQYSATVEATTSSVTVSAIPAHPKGSISINGQSAGRGPNSVDVPLEVGANTITVIVTAEKKKRTRTYTITIERPVPTYAIGGTVGGLTGELTLQNNGGDDLLIAADGEFAFAAPIEDGSTYNVTVSVQPAGQECSVEGGEGTVSGGDVTDVAVTCVANTFTVGGQLSGLTDSVTLQNNGADDLVLNADGEFTFATALIDGANYDVTVSSQPAGQECTVSNGAGTISGANVTNIAVDCGDPGTFLVVATVDGLVGTAVLQLNGGLEFLVTRNGVMAFAQYLADGADYEVTVLTQPASQTCTVTNGSGTIAGDHARDIAVDCTGAGVVASSIFDWNWVEPQPQGNTIASLASDGSQIVAVGSAGTVMTSPDGLTWTTHDTGTADPFAFSAVAWGNGKFVAVGAEMGSSTDGATWQIRDLAPQDTYWGVLWAGDKFVAWGQGIIAETGLSISAIATSPDGVTWSVQEGVGATDGFGIESLAWNGSVFVATEFTLSQGYVVLTSADLVTWTVTQPVLPDGDILLDIASDGTRFVAQGTNGNAYRSLDGITWDLDAPGAVINSIWLDWDGSRFVALGFGQIYTSPDGALWTSHLLDSETNWVPRAALTHGGLHIVAGDTGRIYTSADDVTWTAQSSGDFSRLRDVIRANGQFVAVGDGPVIRTSPDGDTWTTRISTEPVTGGLNGVTFGGGQYVVVGGGPGSQVMTSPDAVTWTSQSVPLANEFDTLRNVAWGADLYVAVGNNGIVLTSPDGIAWTRQTSIFNTDDRLLDVAYNGSLWVATGWEAANNFDAYVATSPDGVNWTKRNRSRFFRPEGIVWNGSQFLAVGPGVIQTSSDGINWAVMQTTARVTDVAWSGDTFIAVGSDTHVLTSTNGQNWTSSRSISDWFYGVATDGSRIVTVRIFGGILTNDSLLGGAP